MDNSLSDLVDICNREIYSDPAMLAGRQSCDISLIEAWNNQCQQYRTELYHSCGKVELYLKSRGII